MRAIFLYHERNEDLFAFFPDEHEETRGGSKFFLSYTHVGQHSDCSLSYARECRAAMPNEYIDLLYELEHLVGYTIEVEEDINII